MADLSDFREHAAERDSFLRRAADSAPAIQVIGDSDPITILNRLWQGVGGNHAFYIGANCGQHLADLSRRFLFIDAFEPDPRSYAVLASLAEHYKVWPAQEAPSPCTVRCHNHAVSSHDGYVELADIQGRTHDTGQLVTPGTRGMDWDPGDWSDRSKVTSRPYPCRSVDSLTIEGAISPPDFMMIDTEGHEFLILSGSARLLRVTRPSLLVEFHSPDNLDKSQQFLRGMNYYVEVIRHPHYRPHSKMWYQHGWFKARYRTHARD